MDQAMNLRHLLNQYPCSIRVVDMAIFTAIRFDIATLKSLGLWLNSQEWFKALPGAIVSWEKLCNAYNCAREKNARPQWLNYLPQTAQQQLETNYLCTEADIYKAVPCMPYTGLGMVILEDGFLREVDEALGIARLGGIRQLASLHDPTVRSDSWRQFPQSFDHTRYVHSVDTCALASIIGTACGLAEQELTLLRLAAQSHDVLTPAGGDTIKDIDPEGLDEDHNYPEVFSKPGWPKLRGKYGISEALLAETILGKGLLGSILDAADKLAYVGRDLSNFLYQNPPGTQVNEDFPELYDRITALLNINPYPCSIWDCAEKRDGQLVFTDADRLADFLRMRALMFRILYDNGSARFREAGLVIPLAKILYEDGTLTRKMLLAMNDMQLFDILNEKLGFPGRVMSVVSYSEDPRCDEFETFQEALAFEQEIARSELETMTHCEVAHKPSTGCLKKFNVVRNGKVMAFSEAYPSHAWDIEEIFYNRNHFRVFSYKLGEVCRNEATKKRLLANRNKRISL